jgi:hypothetical protein
MTCTVQPPAPLASMVQRMSGANLSPYMAFVLTVVSTT